MEPTKDAMDFLKARRTEDASERLLVASQWDLMWLHFRRHKLAMVGLAVVALLYLMALLHGFIAPYHKLTRTEYINMPPQALHFRHEGQFTLRPFVYGISVTKDMESMSRIFEEDTSQPYTIRFWTRGDRWDFLGLFKSDRHLFGVEEGGVILLMGADELGRDLFSRILYGAAISLSIGLLGVISSFALGAILGGISGFYGGVVDMIIQRLIEFLLSVPTIPLWMALSAAVPISWPPVRVYFAITIILSIIGWCGLARIVRSKLLELREEDFVMAAVLAGSNSRQIIMRHLLPSTISYLIVHMTLSIPGMIIGETSLSFLGLGLRAPVVSWGVLLQKAQNVGTINSFPWLMWPGAFVILTVLSFNFMGDGLRDAADPYIV
jgi:peptide/nickel transport system permease protein